VTRISVLLFVSTMLITGCGSKSVSDYVPDPSAAHEALIKVLEAWKRGEPVGPIDGKPAVQVGDSQRQPGQVLESYEILGETGADGGRRFAVQVKFANPPAEEKVDYIVLGIDPLWVMRREDYNVIGHWEHKMTDE